MPENTHTHTHTHTQSCVSVVRQSLPPVCVGRVRKRPLHNWSAPCLTPLMPPQFLEEMILSVCKNRRGEAQRSIRPASSVEKKAACIQWEVEELHKCFVYQPHTAASMGLSSELSLIHGSFLSNRAQTECV